MATLKIAVMGAAQSGKTQLTHELTHFPADPAQPQHTVLFVDAPPLMAALLAHLRIPNILALQVALVAHQSFDFTLLCGLDLTLDHGAQTLQSPDSRTQEAQDAALRTCLVEACLPFAVVYGQGRERVTSARRALDARTRSHLLARPETNDLSRWHLSCENCSDPACERALFTGLLKNQTY